MQKPDRTKNFASWKVASRYKVYCDIQSQPFYRSYIRMYIAWDPQHLYIFVRSTAKSLLRKTQGFY